MKIEVCKMKDRYEMKVETSTGEYYFHDATWDKVIREINHFHKKEERYV